MTVLRWLLNHTIGRLLRWLFPNGIQGERGGWRDP